ncbi:MAG: hypothetical protein P8X89_23150, partial [Reinekea sp.]
TLGGMRLKYAYLPPKVINEEGNYVPAAVQQLQIEFSENGRICKHQVGTANEYEQHADCEATTANTPYTMNEDRKIAHSFQGEVPALSWAFWWEPINADGSARWENDLEIDVKVTAEFEHLDDDIERYTLVTRELGPPESAEDPLMKHKIMVRLMMLECGRQTLGQKGRVSIPPVVVVVISIP